MTATTFEMLPIWVQALLLMAAIYVLSLSICVNYSDTNRREIPEATIFLPFINTLAAIVIILKGIIMGIEGLINLIKNAL